MPIHYNHTKIVATLGPASASPDKMWALVKAGVDVFRLNASHGTHDDHQQMIDNIRQMNHEHSTDMPVLLDLQGPKIRIGDLDEDYAVQPGDTFWLCSDLKQREGDKLPIQYQTFARDVKAGDPVLVEDGKVKLEVLETDGQKRAKVKVLNGTRIAKRKGVNLPQTKISLPSLTDKDMSDLMFGIQNQVEWLALSFVRSAEDVLLLKQVLQEAGSKSRIISKIEKPEAVQDIDRIISASDAIMVARGDLGVEIPIERVPFEQKRIIKKCNAAAKPVIVATQMLESMIESAHPTRAEATDCANAVLDGADALMLSGETSVGEHPVLVIETMRGIIEMAEKEEVTYMRNMRVNPDSRTYESDVVCMSAVQMADSLKANAIAAMTNSGYTAFQLSRHRPPCNIFIFTDQRPLIKALSLVWGVRAFYYDGFESTDSTIADVIDILEQNGCVKDGDIVINAASMPLHARKRTNMIKFSVVGDA
ncbi:MAG: pyruvate kinase [Bacteroidota bacterium]